MNRDNKDISIRAANQEDAETLFGWRNHPETRRMFINQSEVDATEHLEWFNTTIASEERILLIGELANGAAFGVVRFDFDKSFNKAEISITISPDLRGQGLSGRLLSVAIDNLRNLINSARARPSFHLTARVRRENMSSIRLFQRAEFKLSCEDSEYLWFIREVKAV